MCGEPRAGDFEWAKTFQAEIPQAYRVVHSSDLLPHMPVCQRLFSGSCDKNLRYPYHQPQEIWYNDYLMSDGKYKICDIFNGEDPNCSNSIPETQFNKNLIEWQGFDMQMRYYGQRLYDYGNAGCEDLSDNRSSTTATTIEVSSMTASTEASAAADAGLGMNYFLVVISCYYFLINHFILKQ
uniref:Fungal lipase-like domain-containing protein n=1 Tax=Panagrolaimus davidi TaxID=227884 RepID=A0A914P4H2_9BILA